MSYSAQVELVSESYSIQVTVIKGKSPNPKITNLKSKLLCKGWYMESTENGGTPGVRSG